MRASPLLSARCPAPSTSGNNLVRAFDGIRGDFYLVFHVFVSAAVLFVAASHVSWKGYRLDALWFEREIWIISQFLFYREVIVFLLSSAKSMLNEHRENNGLYIGAYASRQSKWGMIQLYVKSYSHASYLLVIGLICMQMDCTYLMMSVDLVQLHEGMCTDCFFFVFLCALSLDFPACDDWNKNVDFIHVSFTVYCTWLQQSRVFSVNTVHRCLLKCAPAGNNRPWLMLSPTYCTLE